MVMLAIELVLHRQTKELRTRSLMKTARENRLLSKGGVFKQRQPHSHSGSMSRNSDVNEFAHPLERQPGKVF